MREVEGGRGVESAVLASIDTIHPSEVRPRLNRSHLILFIQQHNKRLLAGVLIPW